MPNITERDISDEVYKKIKKNAEANKRSINSEILYGLECNYSEPKQNKDITLTRLKKLRDKTKGKIYLSDADILKAKEIRDWFKCL
ncbi:MAG: Arc family DNA-binding protein [Cyanobacteria bacterium J06600_6]